ncbi:MAG: gliding motility-associated ABC transporter substrate-binding protein GldG [Paludibacteraceae bacterium]|nr:gliding motility-associated ABC transporter substrate-binding protein GldG [Paludibacteraceae bacterium]
MKDNIIIIAVVLLAGWLAATRVAFFRIDLTEEKRYSISKAAKGQLEAMKEPLTLRLYLTGKLDANMARLKSEVTDLVTEMNMVSAERIEIEEIDPSEATDDEERMANYRQLEERGIRGLSVSDRSRSGQVTESVIFPWAELCSSSDTMAICLMNPGAQATGEMSVNTAVGDVEFQIIDAVRVLNHASLKKIAFIEGHGELPEPLTFDISDALSRYFQVDRGVMGKDPTVLDPYSAIIIAKPKEPFSESDKFIIDQYIMHGGSVLWLIDGVMISDSMLSTGGMTPLMANDVNLGDQLFKYGVRVTPTVVEDMQCSYMPVNMAGHGEKPRFEPIPWTFSPLLQLSPLHPITKTLTDVKVDYASGIEIVGDTVGVTKEVLMVTSNASHVTGAPGEIDVMQAMKVEPEDYFIHSYVPIGVALEGRFSSIYTHRMPPEGITAQVVEKSEPTRMVVVADGDLLRNDVQRTQQGMMYLPVGFDRVTQQQHGNRDFVVNAMLYLTDDEGIMQLRRRQMPLRMLNRVSVEQRYMTIAAKNVLLPIAVLALMGFVFIFFYRRRYAR